MYEVIWKNVKGFENYKINNLGQVLNVKRNKILKDIVSDKYKNDLEVAEQGNYVRKFYYDSRG